jgi:LmbE family N-acetylglucosaminyl deacetylase
VPDVGERTTADAWRQHPSWGHVPPLELTNADGEPFTRLVVVAAHPDDETLGAGGLIARAHAAGLFVYVVLLTAGESYAHRRLGRHAVATLRLSEVQSAIDFLAPDSPVVFLGATDGEVARYESEVATSLAELIGDGRRTLVMAPWRHDGDTDHDAAGRAAAEAARASGARLAEYPLRAWYRLRPDEAPWSRMRQVVLSSRVRETKERAIAAHVSQVRADLVDGTAARLPQGVLAHYTGPAEHFVVE